MSNKVFIVCIIVIILGTFSFIVVKQKNAPPIPSRPGVEQADKGRKHVAAGAVKYGGLEPPTSGDHTTHIPWQAYSLEVPDENVIHNLEHGGIYISYRPDLPADQIAKIIGLFSKPFSNVKFTPSKAVVAPRGANGSPIIMSSWNRSMKFDSFDEAKMMEYYIGNIGKAPEGTAN